MLLRIIHVLHCEEVHQFAYLFVLIYCLVIYQDMCSGSPLWTTYTDVVGIP